MSFDTDADLNRVRYTTIIISYLCPLYMVLSRTMLQCCGSEIYPSLDPVFFIPCAGSCILHLISWIQEKKKAKNKLVVISCHKFHKIENYLIFKRYRKRLEATDERFKGSLTGDIRLLLNFFINQFPPGPWVSHWRPFQNCATIFGDIWKFLLRCLHYYNDFLLNVHFGVLARHELSPGPLLQAISCRRCWWNYRRCCGTVTIFYGSGSDIWQVRVLVPAPTFDKLRFWFRFRFQFWWA
jgi:hypothetical protein